MFPVTSSGAMELDQSHGMKLTLEGSPVLGLLRQGVGCVFRMVG